MVYATDSRHFKHPQPYFVSIKNAQFNAKNLVFSILLYAHKQSKITNNDRRTSGTTQP
jgi:hypothetical protein